MEKSKKTFYSKVKKWLTINRIILISGVTALIAPFFLTRKAGFISFENTGQIGDTIGGITSPIIGLLGAYLVYKALQAQIDANSEIAKQFKEQQRADYEQKKILVRQNFEQTFFNMLDIHISIVEQMRVDKGKLQKEMDRKFGEEQTEWRSQILEKREVFRGAYDVLISSIEKADDWHIYNNISVHKTFPIETYMVEDQLSGSTVKSVYREVFKVLNTDLGHYYRNLYRIVKMIHKQNFLESAEKNDAIKYFYTSIVRSQLSDYEIHWLFFNGISEFGEKFKPLIIEYSFLKILDHSTDPQITKLRRFYEHPEDRAFKNTRVEIEI